MPGSIQRACCWSGLKAQAPIPDPEADDLAFADRQCPTGEIPASFWATAGGVVLSFVLVVVGAAACARYVFHKTFTEICGRSPCCGSGGGGCG